MNEEEIEVINNEIKENLIASNCSLASSRDIEKWQKAALVQEKLLRKYKQLKEVIEEVREYVNNHIHQETFTGYMDSYELRKLLQILDKVKEDK